MEKDAEQNKTEEATPFKLKRARQRGAVARGIDLAFFATLAALSIFALMAGEAAVRKLGLVMRQALISTADAEGSSEALAAAAPVLWPSFEPVALLGATVVVIVALLEVIQLRGVVFSTHPLKPDFSRLNPAKGLKRLVSMRMLKETAKNVLKLAAYSCATILLVREAFEVRAQSISDATSLVQAMHAHGLKLLFGFVALALVFAAIDQVLARGEFTKQMRMSRRELLREHKEREGEPRLKQKRKQLHASLAKQARALGNLTGADLIIVNPEHYAVALAYDATKMTAPTVVAKGRNHFARLLKRRAAVLTLPTFHEPKLARALYTSCEKGAEVPQEQYRAVAALYVRLRRPDGDRSGHGGD
jgi:flagellar biosynthesis protein FlhB